MKCTTCNREYSPDCDWQQGRCPHHPPLFNIQPRDTSKGHFYVSLVKSAFRVAAGSCIIAAGVSTGPVSWLVVGGAWLIAAEILGVIEEIV